MIRDKSTRKLREANREADSAASAIDKLLDRIDKGNRVATKDIQGRLESRVRGMLVSNYAKSGVATRTGTLLRALQQAQVKVSLGKNPRVVISLPAGYENAYGEGSNFYKAAAAVNYGAVRGAKNANKKEKRKAKKNAYKKADKIDKVSRELYGDWISDTKARTTEGYSVTRPKEFWTLTTAQKQEISAIAGVAFSQIYFG